MKKQILTASIMTVLGLVIVLIGLVLIDFDFSRLNNAQTVTNTYTITEDFENISIDTDISNISFFLSNDESCEIFCQETEKNPHTVRVENGMLTVRQEDHRKWYDYIGFNFTEVKVVITLPKAEYEQLQITSATGKAEIGNPFSFNCVDIDTDTGFVNVACTVRDSLNISTTAGAITVKGVTVQTLKANCDTGKITLTNVVAAGALNVETTTGAVLVEDCTAGSLEVECSTGKITLNSTVVSGQLSAETSTGDITLNGCDAESLDLESDTGDITGMLLTEKIIYAESDTGKISVPRCNNGGRCEITTDTGDINVQIVGS